MLLKLSKLPQKVSLVTLQSNSLGRCCRSLLLCILQDRHRLALNLLHVGSLQIHASQLQLDEWHTCQPQLHYALLSGVCKKRLCST